VPEFNELQNKQRKKVKVLNLISVKELRSIEEHKLDDITQLKICLHKQNMHEHDVKFVTRVLNF